MTESKPGCLVEGCTKDAAFMLMFDNRLSDQYRCAEHVLPYVEQALKEEADA